jgi:hypothetical protein
MADVALFQVNLTELQGEVEGATGPSPKASDLGSISAFQAYMKGYYGGTIPESEVRQLYRIGVDGRVGEWLGHSYPRQSVMLEEERFDSIDTPLLAVIVYPSAPNPGETNDALKLSAYRASEKSRKEAQIAIFKEQLHAKVIVIPNATHFVFLSHEDEVISMISNFVDNLPATH